MRTGAIIMLFVVLLLNGCRTMETSIFDEETEDLIVMVLEQQTGGYLVSPTSSPGFLYHREDDSTDDRLLIGKLQADERKKFIQGLKSIPNCDAVELVDRYISANSRDITFPASVFSRAGHDLDELQEYRKKQDSGNGKHFGAMRISVPVYDAKSGIVLVSITRMPKGSHGRQDLVAFRLQDGRLVEVRKVGIWIE